MEEDLEGALNQLRLSLCEILPFKSKRGRRLFVAMVVMTIYAIYSSWIFQRPLTDREILTHYQDSIIDLNND